MKSNILKSGLVFYIIVVLLSTSIFPNSLAGDKKADQQKDIDPSSIPITQKTTSISLSVFGKTGLEKQDIIMSSEDATQLYMVFQELKKQIATDPFSEKTQQTQNQFLDLLEEKNALPQDTTKQELTTLLQPLIPPAKHPRQKILPFESTATEWMCTFVSEGSGTVLPIIILPRLIPILLTPIPRAFVRWNVKEGFTSCGGLRSGTGFIAYGEQKGVALGFWGIGITFSLPPIMNTYGLIGYSLYASVTADVIDHYPPNTPPEITQTDPADGEQMVLLSTTELRFELEDYDGDLMSYNVTTQPDIGSGNGGLKPDGTYSIPISGLESLTQYTWHIQVTDGKDTVDKICSFTTEPVAPIISNPLPTDGEREVPLTQSSLRFSLSDFQGDAMSYTVETAPDIGSGSGTNIHNGTYTISVNGLAYGTAYHWYVNVTDGAHETRQMFSFTTGYPALFNPFDYGFQYRKQITIDHSKVAGNLSNFTILFSIVDADLHLKAQDDGGDILFMNDVGVASKLYHEIENYDVSSGVLIAWIKIPILSSTNDTIFYMYYGNPTCADTHYPQKTWDSNYNAVWHMNDLTTSTIADSTRYAVGGTKKGANEPLQMMGQIGMAQDFDGSNDYVSVADNAGLSSLGPLTIEVWFGGTYPGATKILVSKDDIDTGWEWEFEFTTLKELTFTYLSTGPRASNMIISSVDYQTLYGANGRHHLVVTWDGTNAISTFNFYIDGSYQSTYIRNIKYGTGAVPHDSLAPVFIGGHSAAYPQYNLDGMEDEVRISNIQRTATWISTEYNNQNNPSSFLSIGPEEPGP